MNDSTRLRKTLIRSTTCALFALGLTGCSAFETSHLAEAEPAVSPNAMASADGAFVAAPFSLVAADSIGLATFGSEIALWYTPDGEDRLVEQH